MVRRTGSRPRRPMPAPYDVALTPGALGDIDRLDRFLRDKSLAAANRMLGAFEAAFGQLAANPFASPTVAGSALRAKVVRFGRDGYVRLYEVRGRTVLVARLFHGREDE